MKIKTHHEHGLSRVELFCVVVATSLLLFFFLVIPCTGTALNNSLRRSKRIMCASNLKQISLGMRLFAHDHGDKFPWMISTKRIPLTWHFATESFITYRFNNEWLLFPKSSTR